MNNACHLSHSFPKLLLLRNWQDNLIGQYLYPSFTDSSSLVFKPLFWGDNSHADHLISRIYSFYSLMLYIYIYIPRSLYLPVYTRKTCPSAWRRQQRGVSVQLQDLIDNESLTTKTVLKIFTSTYQVGSRHAHIYAPWLFFIFEKLSFGRSSSRY